MLRPRPGGGCRETTGFWPGAWGRAPAQAKPRFTSPPSLTAARPPNSDHQGRGPALHRHKLGARILPALGPQPSLSTRSALSRGWLGGSRCSRVTGRCASGLRGQQFKNTRKGSALALRHQRALRLQCTSSPDLRLREGDGRAVQTDPPRCWSE